MVTLGQTTWKTSIFPDGKNKTYVMGLKAQVRKRESVMNGDVVVISIKIDAL